MQAQSLFNCYLIGEGNLLIECAEILLQHQHEIRGIVSPDRAVERWANSHDIVFLKTLQELLSLLETTKCDYLFSVVNYSILSPQILNLVGKAINYHDALLPKYAGVNASTWAIINGEKQHGITWHEMSAGIDTGNIIKQTAIDLEPTETALSLNLKCYQAAIATFTELITELATNQVTLTPQSSEQRSYFGRYQKPQALGIIDFEQPAAVIDNLVRGLDFGNYPNPLTTAKLLLNLADDLGSVDLDYVIVTKVQTLSSQSQRSPGTVFDIQANQLIVATASQDIALQSITTKQGKASSIKALVEAYQLQKGQKLPKITAELSAELVKLAREVASGESYWCKQLAKGQPFSLPGVQKLKTQTTAKDYQRVQLPLSPTVIDFIQQTYVRSAGRSALLEVIVATWGIYLTRLRGNQEITIGFERSKSDRRLAPWFANYLPVNLKITPEQNLIEVLEAIAQRTKLNQKYQTYATDLIPRSPQLANKQTNFPITVTSENQQGNDNFESDLILTVPQSDQKSDSFLSYISYNTEVFSPQQIALMLDQWKTLVEGIASHNTCPVSQLSLLSSSAKKHLLSEWNQSAADYPTDLCIHQLFEARVVEDADAIAVVCQEKSLTRGELNRRANQLAHHLQQLGIQPETLVGICLERSLEMAIAVFAVLKAGGAYVPLDPNYPSVRLNYLLEDAQVDVLLTQASLKERLPKTSAQIICLDRDWDTKALKDTNPTSSVQSHNLAYVIYTSGSTGNPKGVAIEHHSAANTLFDIEERFAVKPQDSVLAVSSLSFDLSVYDLFGVLGSGGTMVIPQPASCPDPEHWLELIAQEQVTIWNSAPALLELLVNYLIGFGQQLPASLRLILLSGDRINPNLVVQLQHLNPQLQIISLGGATEASIWSICYPITQNWSAEKTIPYGRPLHNQSFYILDSQQQLVPIGIAGELYIGGVGVARGYLHRPELNASKFIANPFLQQTPFNQKGRGDRLYKTGDLGRYFTDGEIEFLGRIDNQVKISGVRIELGEIEATLLQCPEIQETLVTVNSSSPEQSSLVAYSILKPNSTLTSQQLRDLLKTQLPEFAIPASLIFLDAFPLTPNGKVDLKALPKNQTKQSETQSNLSAIPDSLEGQLTQIWSRILNVRPIARDDNFFELGGNSLLALRLFEQIQKVFGKNLPLATLFTAPTIAQLTEVMRDQGWSAPWSALVSIQPHGTKPPFFCIHPVGGNVLTYYTLAEAMGTDRPFYGLQSKGLSGQQTPSTSIEAMAADYLQEIKLIQPQGPYYLGGHSFGGFVAYEMALQLEKNGEKVAVLALFDCLGPNCLKKYQLSRQLQIHLNNLAQSSLIESLSYLQARIAGSLSKVVPRSIQEKYFELTTLFMFPKKRSLAILEHHNYQLINKYRQNICQAYGGKIVLFRAKIRTVEGYFSASGGWEGLALGGIDVYDITGDHLKMILQPEIASILVQEFNSI
jgi:amino acid adenylation domain-containing protein